MAPTHWAAPSSERAAPLLLASSGATVGVTVPVPSVRSGASSSLVPQPAGDEKIAVHDTQGKQQHGEDERTHKEEEHGDGAAPTLAAAAAAAVAEERAGLPRSQWTSDQVRLQALTQVSPTSNQSGFGDACSRAVTPLSDDGSVSSAASTPPAPHSRGPSGPADSMINSFSSVGSGSMQPLADQQQNGDANDCKQQAQTPAEAQEDVKPNSQDQEAATEPVEYEMSEEEKTTCPVDLQIASGLDEDSEEETFWRSLFELAPQWMPKGHCGQGVPAAPRAGPATAQATAADSVFSSVLPLSPVASFSSYKSDDSSPRVLTREDVELLRRPRYCVVCAAVAEKYCWYCHKLLCTAHKNQDHYNAQTTHQHFSLQYAMSLMRAWWEEVMKNAAAAAMRAEPRSTPDLTQQHAHAMHSEPVNLHTATHAQQTSAYSSATLIERKAAKLDPPRGKPVAPRRPASS